MFRGATIKTLLTGFEPFGESPLNPSQLLVESAPKTLFGKADLVRAVLPVDKDRRPAALLAALDDHQPYAVVCFGLTPAHKCGRTPMKSAKT